MIPELIRKQNGDFKLSFPNDRIKVNIELEIFTIITIDDDSLEVKHNITGEKYWIQKDFSQNNSLGHSVYNMIKEKYPELLL